MDLAANFSRLLETGDTQHAIEYRGKWYTWEILGRIAQDVTRQIKAAGVPKDAAAGFIIRNRPEHIAGLLLLLASKRCASMISPLSAPARIIEQMRSSNLRLYLASSSTWEQSGVLDAARKLGAAAISISDDGDRVDILAHYSPSAGAGRTVAPDCAAELLTSGTTGSPKRVPVSRDTLNSMAIEMQAMLTAMGDRVDEAEHTPHLVFQPLSTIGGLVYSLPSLATGRQIVLQEKFELAVWREAMSRHRIKLAGLSPAVMRMVVDGGVTPTELASVKAVRCGNAALDSSLRETFERIYGIPILTLYGASEFCGPVCAWTLDLYHQYAAEKSGSVGRPLPNVDLRVVDADTNSPLAPGVVGLLEVKAKRMGTHWQCTNDLASIDKDGFLFLHGRADSAINRGGFKVLPQEVAAVINQHPAVATATVIGLPDRRLGEVPAAAIELKPDMDSVTPEDIELFLRDKLLAYQIPKQIVIVDALPRNHMLKVSQHELPALFKLKDE